MEFMIFADHLISTCFLHLIVILYFIRFNFFFSFLMAFGFDWMQQTPERTLDAPDIIDDYYLNLLDWGSSNILAIGLGSTVHFWDGSNGSTSELVTVDDENGPVTSISWAADGQHIAIGLNNSDVQLWDSTANQLVCRFLLFEPLDWSFVDDFLIE